MIVTKIVRRSFLLLTIKRYTVTLGLLDPQPPRRSESESNFVSTMSEEEPKATRPAIGGLVFQALNFCVAVTALVVASISFRTAKTAKSPTALASSSNPLVTSNQLHGVWQVCGNVNAIMVTGPPDVPYNDLKVQQLSAYLTYVFRPASDLPPENQLLFEGDRCGFSRLPLAGEPPPGIQGNSPTVGTLSPDGLVASFMQYFNSSGVVAPSPQPKQTQVQHLWQFKDKETATVSIFIVYQPSASAGNESIVNYQGSAIYKRIGGQMTCEEVASAVSAGSLQLATSC